jgi:two-component system, NarL family, sensor histidine kinase DevS
MSAMPYHAIEDPAKLRRVLEAALLIEAELELPALLAHVIEEARSMTAARYGALGVLDEEHTGLSEFVTVGLSLEEEAAIGLRPTGHGVLGLLIGDPRPLRLANLGSHPESFGVPFHHPQMTSFLGVPITVRNEVYGILYLTDKVGSSEFTGDDEALVGTLALVAGIAIDNARLHRRVRDVAVFDDRDRVARDLHDTAIQGLFALGLSLQSLAGSTREPRTAEGLLRGIDSVDDTIRQIRSTIFELGTDGNVQGVRMSVLSLLRDLDPMLGFEIKAFFDGPIDSTLPDQVTEHLLATIREAVTNIGRHAQATRAELRLKVANGQCVLQIIDNGRGIGATTETTGGGLGLVNMRRRAEKLHGEFTVLSPVRGGTKVTWAVPLEQID